MKFSDIVELAKQGYTPKDIKDLMNLSDDQGTDEDADQKTQDNAPGDSDAEPEAQPEPEADADDLDYKSMYEAEKEKTAKLQKLVLSADMSDRENKKSDADIFADVMKSFM